MRRSRLLAALAGTLALASVSTWLFAAEASGPLPPGRYEAATIPDWPLPETHAEAARLDALRRAQVRLPDSHTDVTASAEADPLADSLVTCRFLADVPSGTSAKFNCVLDGGEVIKVKYSRNPEIHAEVAATRLVSALGYAADHVRIVERLRCYGCPRYPFFTSQILWLTRAFDMLPEHGFDDAYTEFEMVAVERRFPAPAIETDAIEGWAWYELAHAQAPREDVDAFRLLAAFLAHWDNKSDNQRLVCLDERPAAAGQPCARPLALIQDLGATFGPVKANLANWRRLPVWADRAGCTLSMKAMPFAGATFGDVTIGEAGRLQLARALSALSRDEIKELFRDARFHEYQSGTDDERDLEAWTAAFQHRVDQIVTAGPCPAG